jgi:uncharacterized protein (TIGR02271 family)
MALGHTHQQIPGQTVYDAEGQKVGTAASLYESDATGTPDWVAVKTGLFGTRQSFVPLAGARAEADGLHVRARKNQIKDAPRIDENRHLSEQEVIGLYRHYGLEPGAAGRPGTAAGRSGAAAPPSRANEPIVRHEERLRAGTETAETGRVRLRKHVVTEEQQVTVPVQHEEVHVTREPVSAEEARAAGPTAEIGDDEREVILHEERPVVAKETVPVERVGLQTETVEEDRQVSGTVRREEVEIEDDTDQRR